MLTKGLSKYFLRYFTAIVMPVLAVSALLLYNDISRNIENTQANAMVNVSHISSQFDLLDAQLHTSALHMSGNESLVSLNASTFDPTTYTATRIFDLLRSYERNLPPNISMIYYIRGGKNIYVNEKFFQYEDFLVSEEYGKSLTNSNLYLNLNSVLTKRSININEDSEDALYSTTIYYPIPEISESPSSTVCFLLEDAYYQNLIDRFFPHMQASMIAADINGEFIYNSASHIYSESEFTQLLINNPQSGVTQFHADGKHYIMLRDISPTSKTTFAIFIPYDIFFDTNYHGNITFFLLVAAMIIIVITTAILLAYSHYKNMEIADKQNEIIALKLSSRDMLIKEMALRRFVLGSIPNGDQKALEYNLNCAGISFKHNGFFVLTCRFFDLTISDTIIDTLINEISCLKFEKADFYPVQVADNNDLAVIINCDYKNAAIDNYLLAFTELFKKIDLQEYSIGCGKKYNSEYKINHSYVESIVAINEKINLQKNGIYIYNDKTDHSETASYSYPYAEQTLIEQSIRNGNSEVAISAINHVLDKIDKLEHSLLIQKCLNFDVINMIVKIAASFNEPLSTKEISHLSSWEKSSDLKEHLSQIIVELTKTEINKKQQSQQMTKQALIEYMQKHFKENDLSLDKFAIEFNLSYSYISKVFKDETGQSFLSYLTQIRLKYIKEQLIETNLPIKEIVAEAGYNDTTNFMRKFKSIEGLTPGQYRAVHDKTAL